MTIAGIGIDLIMIERMRKAVERWGEPFLNRVFTKKEQSYSYSYGRPYTHLAGRFGAKEAFLKAIGTGWRMGIKWTDIEVIKDENGKPKINIYGILNDIILKKGIKEILVSISHERDYAIAEVILVS